jgi:lysophospholipase L1-like esterase
LVSICLFIPAAEIALRITCTYCTWTEQNGDGFVSPYALREKSWYHVREPNSITEVQLPEFDYEISTNSLGLRDIEHPQAKPAGEFRLLAIGDSFTEGWGARFEHTWLNALGRVVRAQHSGGDISMICGGASGSDPFYGYRIMVDKLLAYQPDHVLLVVNHSDIMDTIVRGGMERFQADGTVKGAEAPPMPWGYESSQFARFILFELFDYTHALVTRSERNKQGELALEKLQQLVLEYHMLLASQGVKFSLVVMPYYNELERNKYEKVQPLIEFALQHQIDVIDTKPYLYEKFLAHDKRLADLYWPGDMHFTELGYRYFAEAVAIGLDGEI